MPEYTVILRQAGEGCDYTIGCGVSVSEYDLDATNPTAAIKELTDVLIEEGAFSNPDQEISEGYIVPSEAVIELDIKGIVKRMRDQRAEEERQIAEAKERKELERLQRKYRT